MQDELADSIWEKISQGETQDYDLLLSGLIRYKGRIYVLQKVDLRWKILDEAHKRKYTLHPEAVKMYQNLKSEFLWPGLKSDVTKYVAKCLTRLKMKIEHQQPAGHM